MSERQIDRIGFLRKGSSLAIGVVASAISRGIPGMFLATMDNQNPESLKGKTIGLQLYSLRDQMHIDPELTLTDVMRMGYRTLELVDYSGGKVFGLTAEEFRSKCDTLGLAILSSHIGARKFAIMGGDEMIMWWDRVFDDHTIMGCRSVVIPKLNIKPNAEDIENGCLYLNTLGKMANTKEIRLAYHNSFEAMQPVNDKFVLEHLIEGTDPDKVDFQLDTFWMKQGGEKPETWLKRYPDRFTSLHIRDKSTIGDNPKMDFKPIFEQFFANGMRDYFVEIEWYDRFAPQVCAQRSFDYLEISPFVV